MEAAEPRTRHFDAEAIRRRGDEIIVTALWWLSVYPIAIEPWLGTWFEAVAVGFSAAVIPAFRAVRWLL